MKITRRSQYTGIVRTMELNITEQQLWNYEMGIGLIQDVFPNLTNSEREFLMTGITDDEWNQLFGEAEEPLVAGQEVA
jgi:hypothetical protein